MAEQQAPKIYAAMLGVMRDIEAIGKNQKNAAQGFMFRGIDDVYNMIQPLMARHGIFSVPRVLERTAEERQTSKGSVQTLVVLKIEYDFCAEDGSKIVIGPIYGEALDLSDKATNKAMAFADKYSLLQAFKIPTKDLDEGDRDSIPREPRQQNQQPQRTQRDDSRPAGKSGHWDKLEQQHPVTGDAYPAEGSHYEQKPKRPGPVALAPIADNCTQIPSDVIAQVRQLAPFSGKAFNDYTEAELVTAEQVVDKMAAGAKDQNNKLQLSVLVSFLRAESDRRKAGAA